MALSNIFREPRREIIESAVGLTISGLLVWGDYKLAVAINEANPPEHQIPVLGGMALLAFMAAGFVAAVYFVAVATHAIGDAICNVLERRGIYLRPRNRP